MSNDRVSSSQNVALNSGSPVTATQHAKSATALERSRIEALAGVAGLEKGAAMIKGLSSSGDDGLTRPRPGDASTVVPPPSAPKPEDGLKVGGVEGFPGNAIRTPGGYTIVPTGEDAAWKIFGPGQSFSDKPMTKVWGDPHVDEKDGTRWDFTKDSNFQLPDGTIIRADTTSEIGKSVTQALTVISGNDKVEVSGVNSKNPKVGQPSHDAEKWLNDNAATLQAGATFTLGHKGDGGAQGDVSWFRSTNGHLDGLVTGGKANFDGKDSYDQIINDGKGGNGAHVDMDSALAQFGQGSLGGAGFLGADVQSFMDQVGPALDSTKKQDELAALYKSKASQRRI